LVNRSESSLHVHTDIMVIPPYETVNIDIKTLKR